VDFRNPRWSFGCGVRPVVVDHRSGPPLETHALLPFLDGSSGLFPSQRPSLRGVGCARPPSHGGRCRENPRPLLPKSDTPPSRSSSRQSSIDGGGRDSCLVHSVTRKGTMKISRSRIVWGGIAWGALLIVSLGSPIQLDPIARIFILAPWVLVPLGWKVAFQEAPPAAVRAGWKLQPWAAALATASFLGGQDFSGMVFVPWRLTLHHQIRPGLARGDQVLRAELECPALPPHRSIRLLLPLAVVLLPGTFGDVPPFHLDGRPTDGPAVARRRDTSLVHLVLFHPPSEPTLLPHPVHPGLCSGKDRSNAWGGG